MKLLQGLNANTQNYLKTVTGTVDCIVEAVVLQPEFDQSSGIVGLTKWV